MLNKNHPILHPADVETKLKQLQIQSSHASLTAIYRDLFSLNTQEQPYRRALAIKALQWVLCAFKPLTIEGLAQAVAFNSDGSTDTVVTGNFLLQVCGSFIIVTNSRSVRFAHRSAKEFSMQYLLLDHRGVEFLFSDAHAQVAKTCLSFLLSFEDASKWASLPTNLHEEPTGLSLTAFEMYACFYWASHCNNANPFGSWGPFMHLFDKFVSARSEIVREEEVTLASTAFQRWISLLWRVFQTDINLEDPMRRQLEDAISDPPTPLFTACIWGFGDIVLGLACRKRHIVNLRNYRGKSCLYLACENGHEKVVNTLRRFGALVDAGHERWGSDLHAAASSGLVVIFSNMILAGAQVNLSDGLYGRTIEAAIRGGNSAIVTRALEAGAEVWLPSTDAPVRPRQRRLRSLCSTEISSSDTLSDEDSVLSDSTQDLVAHSVMPSLGNKASAPPEPSDLLERLRRASLRRRELLNCWRLSKNMATVDLRASDEPVIAEEASSYLTEMGHESAVKNPLRIADAYLSHANNNHNCYYCFKFHMAPRFLSWW